MLWLITATNHDSSFRQWAEVIDTSKVSSGFKQSVAADIAESRDPHYKNPGHSLRQPMDTPHYVAKLL